MSTQNFLLKKYLRQYYKPRFSEEMALDDARASLDNLIDEFMPPPADALSIDSASYGGIDCETLVTRYGGDRGTMVYIHGGMFHLGSPLSHRGLTAELASMLSMNVVVPRYRLAPEHPYPAARQDLLTAYDDLVNQLPKREKVFLVGDQSGAGLALELACGIRDEGLRQPNALIGLSGLFDFTLGSATHQTNAEADHCFTEAFFQRGLNHYLPEDQCRQQASPLSRALHDLPPVLLQAAEDEMLVGDSHRLAEAIREQGGRAELDLWADVPSCWHIAAVGLPEGRSAIKRINQFIKTLPRR